MHRQFRTTNAAHLGTLGIFRDFIDAACAESGLHPDICFALKLAMDEACTNIIQHGYADMNPGSIILELEIDRDEAFLRITDFGHPFEPIPTEAPDLQAAIEDRLIGGFGLFFIYSTMDAVDYHSDESGNTLTLTKKLTPDG